MIEKDLSSDKYFRQAAALILSKRYRTQGAPVSKVYSILKKTNLPLNEALRELEKRFRSVGLILRRIHAVKGSKKTELLIAVTDPEIDLDEIRPFDPIVSGVLALIFLRTSEREEVEISRLLDDLTSLLNDADKATTFLNKAINKLVRENIIKVNESKGTLLLTELGRAIKPSAEIIDKIIIESLAKNEEQVDETRNN